MKSGIKFIIVGVISTLIDFIIYMILSTKISFSISKAVSMCISCINSFFLNRKWTFEIKKKYTLVEIIKYILVQFINITINVLGNKLFYWMIQQKIIAFVCATVIAMCVNYCLQRLMVFSK